MAIEAKDVALTIPTRGDVDLTEILNRLPDFKDVIVWNNAERTDLKVYARYAAIAETDAAVIATQDDDCIVPWEDILPYYAPARLLANMDRDRWGPGWGYPDSTLVGWGAVFDRDLPTEAFRKYGATQVDNADEVFARTCDVVFSSLTPRTVIDVGYRHLPWATAPNRMWTGDPNHSKERNAVLDLCRKIRTWPDDDVRITS